VSLGTVAPFFRSNVRGVGPRRHKLFMGDTGSQTLGLVVAVLCVAQMRNGGTVLAQSDFVLALSPLVVPVFDAVHVFVFRVKRGRHPFRPDTTHIHHRVAGWGLAPRAAVAVIVALSALYVALDAALVGALGTTFVAAVDVALWVAFNVALGATRFENGKICFKKDTREITKSENNRSNNKMEHNLNY
jgi:UDP-N-acetylmuramyl pentapeptide phosphotransferase/UDP-N-acetylglucosamine-1-phosphate transferase